MPDEAVDRLTDAINDLVETNESSMAALNAMATTMNDLIGEVRDIRNEVELLRSAVEQANVAGGGRGV